MVDQAAAHLREGIQSGRWVGQLPGVLQLAGELVVSKHIVRSALQILEEEGSIENCGAGRRRRIKIDRINKPARRFLRIGIMLYEPMEDADGRRTRILFGIRQSIETLGHTCIVGDRSLTELKDNPSRISRLVNAVDADAWIVFEGSHPVLEWFVAQPFPVYAFGGRFHELSVACSATRIAPAVESAVNTLVDLGHRRIVLFAPTGLRKPTPIPSIKSYLSILEARGIAATDYNLPHFDDTPEGLESCLDRLFRITPPTALIVNQASYFSAVFSYLACRGLRVPRDVSVITAQMDPILRLCLPPLDHFHMPPQKHIVRISRWVNGVAKGRPDKRQVIFDAVYVPGGSVGPAKK